MLIIPDYSDVLFKQQLVISTNMHHAANYIACQYLLIATMHQTNLLAMFLHVCVIG